MLKSPPLLVCINWAANVKMSSSGTPVGLGYGDFRDRDGRVSSIHEILMYIETQKWWPSCSRIRFLMNPGTCPSNLLSFHHGFYSKHR